MAAKGRKSVDSAEINSVFGQIRPMFGMGTDFQIVNHEDGRVSLMRVTDRGLVVIWDKMSGNGFLDAIKAMLQFLPHVDQLPGGRVVG